MVSIVEEVGDTGAPTGTLELGSRSGWTREEWWRRLGELGVSNSGKEPHEVLRIFIDEFIRTSVCDDGSVMPAVDKLRNYSFSIGYEHDDPKERVLRCVGDGAVGRGRWLSIRTMQAVAGILGVRLDIVGTEFDSAGAEVTEEPGRLNIKTNFQPLDGKAEDKSFEVVFERRPADDPANPPVDHWKLENEDVPHDGDCGLHVLVKIVAKMRPGLLSGAQAETSTIGRTDKLKNEQYGKFLNTYADFFQTADRKEAIIRARLEKISSPSMEVTEVTKEDKDFQVEFDRLLATALAEAPNLGEGPNEEFKKAEEQVFEGIENVTPQSSLAP